MKLLDHFVVVAQRRRLSEHTIDCYLSWLRQFMTFSADRHGTWKHPAELGTADAEAFLNDLVIRRRLSASSQNQALCALAFLYRHVLDGVNPGERLGKFLPGSV
jgi:site-specific recombinase XerD